MHLFVQLSLSIPTLYSHLYPYTSSSIHQPTDPRSTCSSVHLFIHPFAHTNSSSKNRYQRRIERQTWQMVTVASVVPLKTGAVTFTAGGVLLIAGVVPLILVRLRFTAGMKLWTAVAHAFDRWHDVLDSSCTCA